MSKPETTPRDVVARAIYEAQNPPYCRLEMCPTWETHPATPREASLLQEAHSRAEYYQHADAVLAALREADLRIVEDADAG